MKRGRPQIERNYKIRTRAWFLAVSKASGMNAAELEVYFRLGGKRNNEGRTVLSGIWNKYQKGIVQPKIRKSESEPPELVDIVDKKFPGTRAWFAMPFWRLLSYDPIEPKELKEIILSLDREVKEIFVITGYREANRFWRLQKPPEVIYTELNEHDSISAAIGVLAMIKEAEMKQDQHQHKLGLSAWVRCSKNLENDPILCHSLNDINAYIRERYSDTFYFSSDTPPKYDKFKTSDVDKVWAAVSEEHKPTPTKLEQAESPFAKAARFNLLNTRPPSIQSSDHDESLSDVDDLPPWK